ncbi:unnamed protein product [Camellia sinensis]
MSMTFWKHQRLRGMVFIQQKFMADHATFGQVFECLDNENLEHLAMMERLLGPLPQHMIISIDLRAEKYFKRSARLDWLEGASSKESTRAVWKLPRQQGTFGQVFECLDNENLEHLAMMERLLGPLPQHMIISTNLRAAKYFKRSARLDWLEGASSKDSTRAVWKLPRLQNSKFKCFSAILRCLLCIGSLPTQPSDPTTNIPTTTTTTTTTFKNPKKNFKTQVKTLGVVARLMGLDSLPDPRKVFRRKEDQKEKIQHKGFSETYRQWTTSVSSQRDGKPYEHRSNRKDSMAQQECKDEYEVLETSKVERSSYPAKRTINSKLSGAEMAFIQQKFMADHGLVLRNISRVVHTWIGYRVQAPKKVQGQFGNYPACRSQNSKFKCFSGILRCLLCIGNLPTQPSNPTTNIPTTTTTFENPKKNFKTQVKTPGVVARLMGLDSLPNSMKCTFVTLHVDGRPPNVIARLMGLDGLPHQQPLHRQHKGFSETYRQWTASVSSQRNGKPYEYRSNRKDSMAQQECKDEYDVLETSKVERSSYLAKRAINSKLSEAEMAFIQQKFMANHGWLLAQLIFLVKKDATGLSQLCPAPMQTGWSSRLSKDSKGHIVVRAEKYFKRSARLDWLEGASSKESTRTVWKLPRLQTQNSKFKCFSDILRYLLYIGSLPTQPSDPTTDVPTTTTTFENQKKNFKTQVKTPGVVARLMGLDLLPDPRKWFSETYRQWTASVSSQRDGKPYEHRSNSKDSTAQQECKDEHDVLETSKVERSSYPAKRTINSKLSEAEMEFIQ